MRVSYPDWHPAVQYCRHLPPPSQSAHAPVSRRVQKLLGWSMVPRRLGLSRTLGRWREHESRQPAERTMGLWRSCAAVPVAAPWGPACLRDPALAAAVKVPARRPQFSSHSLHCPDGQPDVGASPWIRTGMPCKSIQETALKLT